MSEFNKYAEQYETIHRQNLGRLAEDPSYFDEHKILELKKYLGVQPSQDRKLRILDYGCSIAKSHKHIASHLPWLEYYGIDPSDESIRLARENTGSSNLKVFDGKTIPFDSGFFDIIFVSCVVHHIEPSARQNVFLEMKRALRAQGFVFIVEHNPFNPLTQYMVKTCPFDEDAQLVTLRHLRSQLKKSGFHLDQSRYVVFLPQKLRKLLPKNLESSLGWCPAGAQYWITAKT